MLEILVSAFILACMSYIVWFAFADDVLSRIAPRYAAKRRVKLSARYERQAERSRARNARKGDRVLDWAKSNPDDPAARQLLSGHSGDSPEGRMRMRQQYEDDYARNRESRAAEVEAREKEDLEWALAHPFSDVGNRHLKEKLAKLRQRLGRADHTIDHCQSMLEFDHMDQAEREAYTERMRTAEAERDAAQESIIRIEMALGVDALTEQQ